jgi:hypothetical protein
MKSGLYFFQRPPGPLNGGIPLSTEIPAPVKAHTRLAAFIALAASMIELPEFIIYFSMENLFMNLLCTYSS